MQRKIPIIAGVILTALAGAALAGGGAVVGAPAPAFILTDTAGNQVSLSDYSGRVVVLEWLNPDCPFVQRHYSAGTMKNLATKYGGEGVVWLTINSTNYMDAEANAAFKATNELPYSILVDQSGEVGHLYGAATTPHMYVVDGNGTLVYVGAIDDDPRGTNDGPATNYVTAALDEVLAGKAVTTAETKPYGCSVKYKK